MFYFFNGFFNGSWWTALHGSVFLRDPEFKEQLVDPDEEVISNLDTIALHGKMERNEPYLLLLHGKHPVNLDQERKSLLGFVTGYGYCRFC